MYDILKHAHSGLRWIALLLLVYAIFNAIQRLQSGSYTDRDKKINLFAMIFIHTQVLLGLVMYFLSPKVQFVEKWMSSDVAGGMYRFFNLEHLLGMIIAAVILTMGRSKAEKKRIGSRDKHRAILINYAIALIIILVMIPWPFRGFGSAWF